MIRKLMTGAFALLAAGTFALTAQEGPKPAGPRPCEGPCPGPRMEQMLSPEAKAQVEAKRKEIAEICKADFEKQKAEFDQLMKLKEQYKANPTEEVKAQIQTILGKHLDARFAEQEAKLAAQQKALAEAKAKRSEKLNKLFEDFMAGKCPGKGKGPHFGGGKKFGGKGPANPMMKGDAGQGALPPPPPPAR